MLYLPDPEASTEQAGFLGSCSEGSKGMIRFPKRRFRTEWPLVALLMGVYAILVSQPLEAQETPQIGLSSWYGQEACRWNPDPACPTASGASLYALEAQGVPYAASWNYPFGARLRVCRADQPGRCTEVVILDRGPAKRLGRLLDMNRRSFEALEDPRQGLLAVILSNR